MKQLISEQPKLVSLIKTFILFCFSGGTSAIVDLGTLYLLIEYTDIKNYVSISIAFLIGLAVNYYLHTYLTFKSSASKGNFIRFMIAVLVNYLLMLLIIEFCMIVIGLSIMWAKFISLPIIALNGFILSKLWVYNERRSRV
ncbi:GtrA family protein [Vibrio nigripulchritudo]|uniref:GtrA family protein n=1 Tax=Vibrio nigripulchritudo TaxID=28173 RepID=UPI0003B2384C|nr:GtrA family protein [Vibrio nigripulchritudo]CCN70289.1 conserved membrane hypothetical protein [Vibrio nigripulchritudo SFn118]